LAKGALRLGGITTQSNVTSSIEAEIAKNFGVRPKFFLAEE
jgi:hypothetical protein